MKIIKLLTLLLITFTVAFSQKNNPGVLRKQKLIDSLLSQMTLEEKIGQMTLFTSDWNKTGPTMRATYKDDIKAGKVGAIFNAYTVKYVRELQQIAVEQTRLHIPLLFGYDVIHGHRTIFPIPLGQSASWDLVAIEKSERIAATEAAAEGINWTFAPMVDIARDPRWGRIAEGAGEDPFLGSQIARARVKGFQGNVLSDTNTIAACAKHFAAYGAAQAGRDYNSVDMSENTLRDVYLPPFKACADAGAETFMTSFNEINGVPSSGNNFLLNEILKREWGFNGFVVTDYTSINEMVPHGFAADEKQAGEEAVNAGVDMDMQGAVYENYLQALVKEQKANLSTIDSAVRRILGVKFDLGLFNDPYRYCNEEREAAVEMSKENLEVARDMARKSCVLLKNDNALLPLKKESSIAIIGPLADNQSELIGPWSAAGDWKKCVSLLKGIKGKLGDSAKVFYAKGCSLDNDSAQYLQEAIQAAMKGDVIILALGEKASMSGEAASRSNIVLPAMQMRLFNEIAKFRKPMVVVLMNGRPLVIPEVDMKATAILETWFAGTEAGDAIADVLYGDYNPSGKLTATFPRSIGQIPIYYSMKNTGRPFDEKNKYTSKYLDIPNTPLYPFGFGLSYTQFKYSDILLKKPRLRQNDSIPVTVTVANIGQRDGEEVVQLYVHDMVASLTQPVRELKGFKKVFLKAGESKQVTITLHAADLAFYNQQMVRVQEPGKFQIFLGGDSNCTLSETIELLNK